VKQCFSWSWMTVQRCRVLSTVRRFLFHWQTKLDIWDEPAYDKGLGSLINIDVYMLIGRVSKSLTIYLGCAAHSWTPAGHFSTINPTSCEYLTTNSRPNLEIHHGLCGLISVGYEEGTMSLISLHYRPVNVGNDLLNSQTQSQSEPGGGILGGGAWALLLGFC